MNNYLLAIRIAGCLLVTFTMMSLLKQLGAEPSNWHISGMVFGLYFLFTYPNGLKKEKED